jgi:predicted transcriptional regulator
MVTTIEIEDELMEKLETLAKARAVSSRELISALIESVLKQI